MYFMIVLASARFIHFDVLYAYRKGVPIARNGITLPDEWGKYELENRDETKCSVNHGTKRNNYEINLLPSSVPGRLHLRRQHRENGVKLNLCNAT